MRGERDWINTFTGRKFWPLDPRADEVDFLDIAHALSMQCRFTGHVRRFYSVAEHSVRVARRSARSDRLWGLLHDASEAYLIDLARPVKHQDVMRAYRDAESRIVRVICDRFGLGHREPASVVNADHRMMLTEARALMSVHSDWETHWAGSLEEPYSDEPIECWTPEQAEREFIGFFDSLNGLTE